MNLFDDFFINKDTLNVNFGKKPSLLEITKKIDDHGPILLRFPHLIKKQIELLHSSFRESIDEFKYSGNFKAVFPIKVNHFPNFIDNLIDVSNKYSYGLEAGSKAELLIAILKTPIGNSIIINGFKDRDMINLSFIATLMGHNITIIIEGINELDLIIEISKEYKESEIPNIGIRVKLHNYGYGIWGKSSGFNSKFGLTSTEILRVYSKLKTNNLLSKLSMIHFHIGSQMESISPFKKALREAGNIFTDLKNKGAFSLNNINIGGGLAVNYSNNKRVINYSLREFSNDIVFSLKEIAKNKNVSEPNIFIESGRFISANHSVLILPVLEIFSQEYREDNLNLKVKNPPIIDELFALWKSIDISNAYEYLHDSLDYQESLLTLFDLGYIDLEDRSNSEILVYLIIKKSISLLKDKNREELKKLEEKIKERYLINFSSFQSLPDFWGLKQHFPIYPINYLNLKAENPATIWDITCDSDGEIPFDKKNPLYLHNIDLNTNNNYYLAIFLSGAYQEVLGMQHNLFTNPTEAVIKFNKKW